MNLPIHALAGTTPLGTAFTLAAALAFLAGGIANASGHSKIRASFVKLGFPSWWCWPTAALELLTSVLLVMADTRILGVALGCCVMFAAIVSVIRIRNYPELVPPVCFLVLLALAGVSTQV